jgi:hypothetical protein
MVDSILKKLGVFIPILLTIVLAFSIMPQTSAAATYTIYSDLSDGFITIGTIISSGGPTLPVGDIYNNKYHQSFVKFSLAGITTVDTATLYIVVWKSVHNNFEDDVSPLTNPGLGDCIIRHIDDYGTLDFGDFNAPSIGNDPGVFIGGSETPDVGYLSIDVTAAMQDDIANDRSFSTFMIKLSTDTDGDGSYDRWFFHSSNVEDTDQDPYIEYEGRRGNPVGGIYAPMNKLNILAPYIALVGLIGAISTIFAIRRWRKD